MRQLPPFHYSLSPPDQIRTHRRNSARAPGFFPKTHAAFCGVDAPTPSAGMMNRLDARHIPGLGIFMSSPGRFTTTRWSLVILTKEQDPGLVRTALTELLSLYMPALRAHLVYQRRCSQDEADELLAGFVADKIIEQNIVGRADRNKGRFRNFLLVSLNHYVISKARSEKGRSRNTSLEVLDHDALGAGTGVATPNAFEVAWARALINETLERMKRECHACGQLAIWGVFEARVVQPILHDAEPVSYDQLAARHDFASPMQAANALVTAKRMFARVLRNVVAAYSSDDEIEEELLDLRRVLGNQPVL